MVFSNIQKRIAATTLILCCCVLFFVPSFAGAQGLINTSGCEVPGADPGNCRNIEILLVQAITVIEYLFGIIGTLAFAMFIYGGLKMILAFGSEDKFKEGKEAMVNAVIGMIIAFSAYILVNFTLDVLGVKSDFRAVGVNGGAAPQTMPETCTETAQCVIGTPGVGPQFICVEGRCVDACGAQGGQCGQWGVNASCDPTTHTQISGLCPGDQTWTCCAPTVAAP